MILSEIIYVEIDTEERRLRSDPEWSPTLTGWVEEKHPLGTLGKVGGTPRECDIMEAQRRKIFESNGSGLGERKTKISGEAKTLVVLVS